MRTIAIANQEGGQGRTITTITLGHGLALRGKSVLLLDTDPQGQVATFLGLRQESGLFDLLVGGRPSEGQKRLMRMALLASKTKGADNQRKG